VKKLSQAMLAALSNIEACNQALAAFEFVSGFVHHRMTHVQSEQDCAGLGEVHATLTRHLRYAYEHLLFVAQFMDDEETRRIVRKMAHDRYVADSKDWPGASKAIMWMLSPTGMDSGSYRSADAEELRAELKAALDATETQTKKEQVTKDGKR